MHKIYCFNNGGSKDWWYAQAIADDGHALAGHICSHPGFMKHDLGITSNWKHEIYDKHFGAGNWELEWVEDIEAHPGIVEAFRLNKMLSAEEAAKDEEGQPKVEIQFSE